MPEFRRFPRAIPLHPFRARWMVGIICLVSARDCVPLKVHAAPAETCKSDTEKEADEDAPADEKTSTDEASSFADHFKAVWQALADRDVKLANREVDAAKEVATDDEKEEVVGLRLLCVCVERFWQAVDAELKRLQPGDELDLDGTKVSVVESKSDSLTLHIHGKNQKSTRAKLPGRWARAVAEHRFDSSAANKLLLGAFLAVDPQGDRKRARRLWEDAQPREKSAEELLKLLASANLPAARSGEGVAGSRDDSGKPAGPSGGQAAIPGKEKLNLATRRMKEKHGVTIRNAKSAEQKLELAKTLVQEAIDSGDDATRLVLLRQALELQAGAVDISAIDETIELMSRLFQIDRWEVAAETVTRAAVLAKGDAAAKVAQRALFLLIDWDGQEETEKSGHAKAAQKLEQAAHSAAQKAHDPDLVKAAAARKKGRATEPE